MTTNETVLRPASEIVRAEERDMSALYGIAGQLGNLSKGVAVDAVFTHLMKNMNILTNGTPLVMDGSQELVLLCHEARDRPDVLDERLIAGIASVEFLAKCADRDPSATGQRRAEQHLIDYATSLSRCGVFTTKSGAIAGIIQGVNICADNNNPRVTFTDHQTRFANGITHSLRAEYWKERMAQAGVVAVGTGVVALLVPRAKRKIHA